MLPTPSQPLPPAASGAAQLASGLPVILASGATPVDAARAAAALAGTGDAFVVVANNKGPLLPFGRARATSYLVVASRAGYAANASSASSAAAASSASSSKSSSATKTSTTKATTPKAPTATAKKSGPLAFLDDKKLSVEEKLMRLLSYLNDKWDKDLDKKMKEIGAGQQKTDSSSSASSSTSKKSSGLLGSLGSVVKAATGFFPEVGVALDALKNPVVQELVSKIGTPVLAAAASAAGYPALAPALLKYGPAVADAVSGIASAFDDGGSTTASAGTSVSGSSSSPSETGMSDSQLRVKLMEVERIQNLQKEMFSLVSNILHAGHETRMNVIQNVR